MGGAASKFPSNGCNPPALGVLSRSPENGLSAVFAILSLSRGGAQRPNLRGAEPHPARTSCISGKLESCSAKAIFQLDKCRSHSSCESVEKNFLQELFVLSRDAPGIQCTLDNSLCQLMRAVILRDERAIFHQSAYMLCMLKSCESIVNIAVMLNEGMIILFQQAGLLMWQPNFHTHNASHQDTWLRPHALSSDGVKH